MMNGVDVSRLKVGDMLELSAEQAEMMMLNGWAEAVTLETVPTGLLDRKSVQTDLPK